MNSQSENSFGARASLTVGDRDYTIHRLDAVEGAARLPYSLKVLVENLLRTEDGENVRAADIEALASWDPNAEPSREILYSPARVLMQDFTGVPAVVDLAAMRDAMEELGGDPTTVEPQLPADLVIDHSIIAEVAGIPDAFRQNAAIELQRNRERYEFLRWGQTAFESLRIVPPNTGIVHQVNLEYLAQVVFVSPDGSAYPDTLVGTDSHTPMVNGLGVLGWGVGGIEAEAAMLGQPVPILIPRVVGFKLSGELPEATTATDLVLTITEMLRAHGVVGKFVEFYGPGVANVPLANRATIGNMSPEYGSTVAIFPIDEETLRYLRFTTRPAEQVALVEAYAKEQGLWHDPAVEPAYSERLELDLSTIVPSIAGPTRPQDRIPLDRAKTTYREVVQRWAPIAAGAAGAAGGAGIDGDDAEDADGVPAHGASPAGAGVSTEAGEALDEALAETFPASDPVAAGRPGHEASTDVAPARPAASSDPLPARAHERVPVTLASGEAFELDHGAVIIAAITSCTNTSNPSVMVAAGLLAKKAVERGLTSKPWVKTSLAPGSKVVMDYYKRAGLLPYLEKLRFYLVGYGCTTCIGNSGPVLPEISEAVRGHDLAVCSVLSGNRNFEGRINPDSKLNFLASPPLVVAYAIAGSLDVDLYTEPLGTDPSGVDVYLRDIWPSSAEIAEVVEDAVRSEQFGERYADVFAGDETWRSLPSPTGARYAWNASSTYVRRPSFLTDVPAEAPGAADITGARVLALLGDSVTTDHISPAGSIGRDSVAGRWLIEQGVTPGDFNSYGARRGNHEVMIRGTFGNIRLRNLLAPGTEGSVTRYLPSDEVMSIYDASQRYQASGTPLIILAGAEYGSGSSRDWAAKGTLLLGVKAVIAESYERIHRSNLIGMGVLPLQFPNSESYASLGLTGEETFAITGLSGAEIPSSVTVTGGDVSFAATVRIDTPREADYYRHGGILQYVLRQIRDRAGA